MNKKIVLGGIAVVLLSVILSMLLGGTKVETVVKELGAVVGPEILQDHLCYNGTCHLLVVTSDTVGLRNY